jgi:hypothetical protein
LKQEHADKGRGDSGPGFSGELEVADEGCGAEFEVGLAVGLSSVSVGEVGVLVGEEVTDRLVDIVRTWCDVRGVVDVRLWLCRGRHVVGNGGGQALGRLAILMGLAESRQICDWLTDDSPAQKSWVPLICQHRIHLEDAYLKQGPMVEEGLLRIIGVKVMTL